MQSKFKYSLNLNIISTKVFFSSFDEAFVSVVGFGLLSFFGRPAKVLQKVSLQILPADKCKDSLTNGDKMCTYMEGKDSCTSDR